MSKKRNEFMLITAVLVCGLALSSAAQTVSVHTTGMNLPNKIIAARGDSLLVAESGTPASNTGRISLIDRSSGARQTLLQGLPSGVNNLGGPPTPSGPSGIVLDGRRLYLAIGVGDAMQNAGGPGLEQANPNPSSPLFNSILELRLPRDYDETANPFTLTLADHLLLANGGTVVLTNIHGRVLQIRLIANLPDSRPNPFPNAPNNLRAANLFGVEIDGKNLYVPDASFNLLYRVRTNNGSFSTFVTFPNKPNPLFPTIGAPTVEAVPDNVRRVGNRLLVPLLTGFPFVANLAEVQSVSLRNGSRQTFIPNLTSAIDVLYARGDDDDDDVAGRDDDDDDDDDDESEIYFTLEFSTNQLAGEPGRLRSYISPTAAPITITANLITPTSMARDEGTGDIFITEIFTGRIIRVAGL